MIPNIFTLFICFGNRGCEQWFRETFIQGEFSFLDALISASSVIGYIIVIGLILFIVIRVVTVGMAYVKPVNRKGVVTVTMFDESTITGNVNEDKMFHKTEIFKVLAKHPKLKRGMDELYQMCADGHIRVFDMKVTDSFKMDLKGGKNIKMVLPGYDVIDPRISWQDTEGEFALWAPGLRSYPTNILASDLSEVITVTDYYGTEMDVLIIAPYSRTTKNRLTLEEEKIVIEDVMDAKKVYINVINLPQKEAIAKMVVFLPTLNEIHKELELKNIEVDNLKEEIEALHKENKSLWDTKEGWVALARTQPIIGFTHPVVPLESKSLIALVGGAVLAGYMSTKLGQIPALAYLKDYDFLFAGAVAIMLMAYLKSQEKKPDTVANRIGVENQQ